MKKMKTLVLAALLICGVGTTYAQNREKVRLGVEAGMTVNTIKNYYDDADRKVGFDAGLRVDVNFTDNIYLGTGLQYMMKGVKSSGKGWESKVNTGYLQIPIHVGYRYDFNETIGINTAVRAKTTMYSAIPTNGTKIWKYHTPNASTWGSACT